MAPWRYPIIDDDDDVDDHHRKTSERKNQIRLVGVCVCLRHQGSTLKMVGALVMRFEMRPADFCILFSASASEILPADINLSVRRTRSTVHPF